MPRVLFHTPMIDGTRVVVSELAEQPLEAIEHFLSIEPMAVPAPASLGPEQLVNAVESAAVGWVDLIMTSGQHQHVRNRHTLSAR